MDKEIEDLISENYILKKEIAEFKSKPERCACILSSKIKNVSNTNRSQSINEVESNLFNSAENKETPNNIESKNHNSTINQKEQHKKNRKTLTICCTKNIKAHEYAYLLDSNLNLTYDYHMFSGKLGAVNNKGMRALFADLKSLLSEIESSYMSIDYHKSNKGTQTDKLVQQSVSENVSDVKLSNDDFFSKTRKVNFCM
ncbi:unnamed protein product [Parnassius apollo]|uniref:(apollo) hypothetical protein n=1 Tax=Parnassius apollo TaxID=110799 RepID=A0A8S3XID0_PARAO|nr:unnamed protein product [Parnassius apollo]